MNVKISKGNSKMGSIPSVSLPSGITCRQDCACIFKCYARKLERLRPNVRQSYEQNYRLLKCDPKTYWREVEAAVMMSRFFRFHVSGDIPDEDYFRHMIQIAAGNPHCEILCFTKKYEIVNNVRCDIHTLPGNLHIIFSAWRGLTCNNPYGFPEAHVRYRDGTTTAKHCAVECGGNCTDCAVTSGGCWVLKPGQQVVFNEH